MRRTKLLRRTCKIWFTFICCSGLTFSSSRLALAQVAEPETPQANYLSNVFGDLHYYTPKGAIEPSFTVSPTLHDEAISSQDFGKAVYRSSTNASATITYGLVDRVWAYVNDSYLLHSETSSTDAATNVTTTTDQRGASDPGFGIGWRVLDDPAAGIYGNLSLNGSPMVNRRKSATATQLGNNAKGDSTMGVSAGLFGVHSVHEYAVNLNLSHSTASSGTSDVPANSYVGIPTTSMNLNPRYRFHATERFYLQPGLYLYYPQLSATRSHNTSNYDRHTQPAYLQENFTVAFLLRPLLLVSSSINYQKNSSYETFTGGKTRSTDSTRTAMDFTVATQL